MNKTFKDPNTKYSDQGTPVAQAKSIADSIASVEDSVASVEDSVASVEEAVSGLGDTVDELSEKVDLIPVPVVADDGKLLGVTLDESGETPVAQYELVAPSSSESVVYIDLGESTSSINNTIQYINSDKINAAILDNMLANGIIPILGIVNKGNGSKPFIFTPAELSTNQSARTFICAMPLYKSNAYVLVRNYILNVTTTGFSLVSEGCYISNMAQYYNRPSADGTYTLKLTKSGYTYTYDWVQDT